MDRFDKFRSIFLQIYVFFLMLLTLILLSALSYQILQDKFDFFEEESPTYFPWEYWQEPGCALYYGDDVEAWKLSGCDCISSSKGFSCKPTEPDIILSLQNCVWNFKLQKTTGCEEVTEPTEIGRTPTDQMVKEDCTEKNKIYFKDGDWRLCN